METTVRVRITTIEGELLDSFDVYLEGASTARQVADAIGDTISLDESFALSSNKESN